MKRIVITGPESTGKTTLFNELKIHLSGIYVEEYARDFMENFSGEFGIRQLRKIGQKQYDLIMNQKGRLPVFADTDLSVIKVWSDDKYGGDAEIDKLWQKQQADLYLLMNPDIPWEPDPLREDPNRREELFERYKMLLKEKNIPVAVIKGRERTWQALEAIRRYLPGPG